MRNPIFSKTTSFLRLLLAGVLVVFLGSRSMAGAETAAVASPVSQAVKPTPSQAFPLVWIEALADSSLEDESLDAGSAALNEVAFRFVFRPVFLFSSQAPGHFHSRFLPRRYLRCGVLLI